MIPAQSPMDTSFIESRRPRAQLCQSRVPPLRWYKVEFPGPFFIKECAFGLVAATPVFVATRDKEEIARPDTLFVCLILILISNWN